MVINMSVNQTAVAAGSKNSIKRTINREWKRNYDLYLLIIPAVAYYVLFHYVPMYGIQIAFKEFMPLKGIWNSPWVGINHFTRFFNSFKFFELLFNTIGISLFGMAMGVPVHIVLALMLNEAKNRIFKKSVQFITYAPHFISTVVLVGMLLIFLSPSYGPINKALGLFGVGPIQFMGEPKMFKSIYVFSGVWQGAGWGSIIYLAALSSIDPQLHEAATIDGASRLQRIWNINIPGIMPTIIIMLILDAGRIMNVGFEKIFLMQNDLNRVTSDVISTYVYRAGLVDGQFSYGAAVGLFNSVINFILIVTVNYIANKVGEAGIW